MVGDEDIVRKWAEGVDRQGFDRISMELYSMKNEIAYHVTRHVVRG